MNIPYGKVADELLEISNVLQERRANLLLQQIKENEQRNSFHVAVLGEFKRGKSSLINSLIGEELLPSDLLPATAVLNVLEYAEQPELVIKWRDGNSETVELTREQLNRFTVEGSADSEQVQFLVLRCNSPILREGLVIIDTPGVNDISESRIEVTKNIIPNCDAALFLLDAAAPVTRSEAEFLQTQVLSFSLHSLLFVISKADRLDEEELEESLQGAEQRLKQLLSVEPNIIAYSAREVMRSIQSNGYSEQQTELLRHVQKLKEKANSEKVLRQSSKLKATIAILEDHLDNAEQILCLDETKSQELMMNIEQRLRSDKAKFHQFIDSMNIVGRSTLVRMFETSFDKFIKDLTTQILDQIRVVDDVEKYLTKALPVEIERSVRLYTERKSKEIYDYLKNFTNHVCSEYNRQFHYVLNLDTMNIHLPELQQTQNENSQMMSMIGSYLPMTALMIAGSIIMPGIGSAIGMAAGHLLQKHLNDKKQSELREKYLGAMPDLVKSELQGYRQNVVETINGHFDMLIQKVQSFHQLREDEWLALSEGTSSEVKSDELENRRTEYEMLKVKLLTIKKESVG